MPKQFVRWKYASALLFACLAASGVASAVPAAFNALVDGETRSASVTPVTVQDTPYLPIIDLVRQLGGGIRLAPSRIQVDLAGKSAVAAINDTAVEASESRFFLRRPIIRQDGAVMIALEDVEVFFWRAFQISLQTPAGAAAAAPPEAPAAEDLDDAAARMLTEWSPAPPVPEETPPSATPALQVAAPSLEAASEELMRLNVAPPADPAPKFTGTLETIVVDAGHGGNDIGCGGQGGLLEKDLTLSVALALRQALKEQSDLRIVLTRGEDRDMPVKERVTIANQQRGGLLVSLHAGTSFSPLAHGAAIFCAPTYAGGGESDQTRITARRDHTSLSRHYASHVAESLAEVSGAAARGIYEAPLQMQRDLNIPCMLVEIGFLSNPAEEALLATQAYQQSIAEGIAKGIIKARGGARTGESAP